MTEMMRAVAYTASLPVTDPNCFADVEVEKPSPGAHDLIVEVRAVSVNPVDVKVRASNDPEGSPKILGFDAAGVVTEVGSEVTLFSPGDEVYYAGNIARPGTNSQFHAVDERIVGRKPSSLNFEDAAALPLTTITAWEGLFDKLRITADTEGTLLMVGATGGVGSQVLQLAETLVPGLRVIATASTPEGEKWVRELGAEEVVNHRSDLKAALAGVAPEGIDFIFTTHSTDQVELYADVMNPFGQIVAIDDPETLDVVPLKSKALSWHWEFMFAKPLNETPDLLNQHELLNTVADLVDAGRMKSTTAQMLTPINAEQLREAHRIVEDGHVIGKIVLRA